MMDSPINSLLKKLTDVGKVGCVNSQVHLSPRSKVALDNSTSDTRSNDGLYSSFYGFDVFVVEDQKADCWLISDPKIAKAYRNGWITEELLERMQGI